MYKKVDSEIVERLGQIVGADNVLVEANDMEPYSHDEVVGLRADPEVVVRATSTAQVSLILKLAQRERIPVTPRGAGMGLSDGAVPICGRIILPLEKMTHILEIDKENLMVTVEPGVIGDLFLQPVQCIICCPSQYGAKVRLYFRHLRFYRAYTV